MPLILSGSAGLSGNTDPVQRALLPAGSVLQVVQASKTDPWASTGTNWTDVTGLVANITPIFASSKILVMTSVAIGINPSYFCQVRLARGGNGIHQGDAVGLRVQTGGMVYIYNQISPSNAQITWSDQFLDSPGSASSQAYSVQMKQIDGSTMYVNRLNRDDNANYEPRSASSITLMEIKT